MNLVRGAVSCSTCGPHAVQAGEHDDERERGPHRAEQPLRVLFQLEDPARIDALALENTGGEVQAMRYALRPLNHLHGTMIASEFGPSTLKAVRELMVQGYEHPKYGPQKPHCRTRINSQVKRIRRMFRWAVENDFWHYLRRRTINDFQIDDIALMEHVTDDVVRDAVQELGLDGSKITPPAEGYRPKRTIRAL